MRDFIDARNSLLEQLPKNSIGAEIGVFKGEFSKDILRIVQPKKLFLVDPWVNRQEVEYDRTWYNKTLDNNMEDIYQTVRLSFQDEIDNKVVELIRLPSDTALNSLQDESLDWVYIDGDHHYDEVSNDLALAYKKIRKQGFICGDDYVIANWFTDDIVRAVNEFIGSHRIIIHSINGSQFILRKRS